jgi:hypothetical protein
VRPPGGGMLMEIVSTQIRPMLRDRVGPTAEF